MTVLDTFYLLFKTDAPGTRADVAALDKQLDDMEKKGKSRSAEENKRYQELKKQRKELLEQTKEQRQETDKLGDSFQNMITGAVGAVAAYTSFGALKSGLVDANRLNASLAVLGKTTGQNAGEIKAFGAALEQAGGKAEDLYAFTASQAQFAAAHRTPLPPIGDYIARLRNSVKGKTPTDALTYLQQIPGAVGLAPLLGLSDTEYAAAVTGGRSSARLKDADARAALQNQEAYAKTKQAFGSLATEIDTSLLRSIKRLNEALQDLANSLQGHPNLALGAGIATAAGGAWAGTRLLRGLGSLIGLGGAATGAEGTGLGAVIAGESASGIGIPAAIVTALAAGGLYWWKNRSGGSPASLSNRDKVLSFWRAQGYAPGAAAGWAANAQAESGFDPLAVNGTHTGLYQWSSDRRAKIKAATGIDVATASLDDQLRAAAWEAKGYGLGPGRVPDDAGSAAALISDKFEVPSLSAGGLAAEAAHRARIASSYGAIPNSGAGAGDGGRTINVKVDNVTIQTQATSTGGIANEVALELRNQIRMAMSNFDDGVLY